MIKVLYREDPTCGINAWARLEELRVRLENKRRVIVNDSKVKTAS